MADNIPIGEELYDVDPTDIDSFELDVADFREQQGLEYPAVLLSNVLFTDCLKVLQSVKKRSYREMDVWVELTDPTSFQKLGTLQIDSDILLLLRHLKISVTIYYDQDNLEVLDLEDPDVLEKFI